MFPMRRDSGFTLIEVLVAFIIAAIALGVLYQGALGGLLATRIAGRTTEAVSLARSRLAAIGHGPKLTASDVSGVDGTFQWRMRIAPTASAPVARGDPAAVARGPHVALFDVTVWISWQENGARTVRLDSQSVGPVPPPTP